jgi:hypothetical protein
MAQLMSEQSKGTVEQTLFAGLGPSVPEILSSFAIGSEAAMNEVNSSNAGLVQIPAETRLQEFSSQIRDDLAGYNEDDEARKALLFLTWIITAPIRALQTDFIEKLESVTTPKELREVFKVFLKTSKMGQAGEDILAAIEKNAENDPAEMKRQMIFMVAVSDVALMGLTMDRIERGAL